MKWFFLQGYLIPECILEHRWISPYINLFQTEYIFFFINVPKCLDSSSVWWVEVVMCKANMLFCCCWLCLVSLEAADRSRAPPARSHRGTGGAESSRRAGRAEVSAFLHFCSVLVWSHVPVFSIHGVRGSNVNLLPAKLLGLVPPKTGVSQNAGIPFPGQSSSAHPTHLESSLHEQLTLWKVLFTCLGTWLFCWFNIRSVWRETKNAELPG